MRKRVNCDVAENFTRLRIGLVLTHSAKNHVLNAPGRREFRRLACCARFAVVNRLESLCDSRYNLATLPPSTAICEKT